MLRKKSEIDLEIKLQNLNKDNAMMCFKYGSMTEGTLSRILKNANTKISALNKEKLEVI